MRAQCPYRQVPFVKVRLGNGNMSGAPLQLKTDTISRWILVRNFLRNAFLDHPHDGCIDGIDVHFLTNIPLGDTSVDENVWNFSVGHARIRPATRVPSLTASSSSDVLETEYGTYFIRQHVVDSLVVGLGQEANCRISCIFEKCIELGEGLDGHGCLSPATAASVAAPAVHLLPASSL